MIRTYKKLKRPSSTQIVFALFFSFIAMLGGQALYAQEVSITELIQSNEYITIVYSIQDTVPNRTYTISLFSSADEFTKPLEFVSGDVGLEVAPGESRAVNWKYKEALPQGFTDYVTFELRGSLYVPFIRLDDFDKFKKFKKKKAYAITWTGGRANQLLNFNLYKKGNSEDERITVFSNVPNVGEYELVFREVAPGKDYYFKIEDAKNKDEVVITEPFNIKRKLPIVVSATAAAGLGVAGYFIISSQQAAEDIPDPITIE